MLDNHLQSKIDNENNHNIIFVLSQNFDKSSYKSSVFWVLISCSLSLLLFPGLKVFVCYRFYLSKGRLCWYPFIHSMLTSFQIYLFQQSEYQEDCFLWMLFPFIHQQMHELVQHHVASFPKLWRPSVQIFLTVLNILSQNKLP